MTHQWKVISQYACGCQVREVKRTIRETEVIGTVIEYCPKHKAAPGMAEVLNDIVKAASFCHADAGLKIWIDKAKEILKTIP